LVINGTFNDGDYHWTLSNWEAADGVAYPEPAGESSNYAINEISGLTEGKPYRLSFEVGGDTGNVRFDFYPLLEEESVVVPAGTNYSTDVICITSTDGYSIRAKYEDGFDDNIDNFSIREILT
jgi:hypothetical protein